MLRKTMKLLTLNENQVIRISSDKEKKEVIHRVKENIEVKVVTCSSGWKERRPTNQAVLEV